VRKKTKGARHDNAGRSTREARFLKLTHFMMETPAWRTLPPFERAVYVELASLYDGGNNGWIGFGVRRASERCGMSINKATACLKTLVARGFIECTEESGFNRKDRTSREWRLTQFNCDRTNQKATSAFKLWTPNPRHAERRPPAASIAANDAQPAKRAA